jgi:ABC-type multidrug transport system permease subunit
MTSTTTIDAIVIEPKASIPTELTGKEKFDKRFKPSNLKQNDQKPTPATKNIVQPLRADDIKEYRLWALISMIFCFFLIGPCIAFYHSRRIRQMKNNEELTRAKLWSDRVNSILIVSYIIGIVIWVAIIFVIVVLFIFGAIY